MSADHTTQGHKGKKSALQIIASHAVAGLLCYRLAAPAATITVNSLLDDVVPDVVGAIPVAAQRYASSVQSAPFTLHIAECP